MPPEAGARHEGRRAIFVYYRLSADKVPALKQAFAHLSSSSQPWQAQLMRRAEQDGPATGLQTWMEIYWLQDDGQDQTSLQTMIEAGAKDAGILGLIDGDRHHEVFESCA